MLGMSVAIEIDLCSGLENDREHSSLLNIIDT